MADPDALIPIEVAVALPDEQVLIELRVPLGATIAEALAAAAIEQRFPELELRPDRLGVFGRPRPPEHVLSAGDRVEIYRPLKVDPKEARRQLAASRKRPP